MANPTGKPKTVEGTVEASLETRRAAMMVLGVETGKPNLQKFFEECLRAHAIDTLKELNDG